jgi:hypothetical protein
MPYGFNDIATAGLTLGSNHGRSFTYAAQGFTQGSTAADKRNLKVVL